MFKLTGKAATGDFGWAEVEGDANLEGPMSINVPGVIGGMCKAHELFGKMPLSEVLAPAVRIAVAKVILRFGITAVRRSAVTDVKVEDGLFVALQQSCAAAWR